MPANSCLLEQKTDAGVDIRVSGSFSKIKVIKALKQATQMNLTDAKKAVEGAPSVVAGAAPKEEAAKAEDWRY